MQWHRVFSLAPVQPLLYLACIQPQGLGQAGHREKRKQQGLYSHEMDIRPLRTRDKRGCRITASLGTKCHKGCNSHQEQSKERGARK